MSQDCLLARWLANDLSECDQSSTYGGIAVRISHCPYGRITRFTRISSQRGFAGNSVRHREAEQARTGHGRRGKPSASAIAQAGVAPAAIAVLAAPEARIHQGQRLLDRNTVSASHPQGQNRELGVRIVAATPPPRALPHAL